MDTIGFYDADPEGYSEKTFGSDMSPTRDRFLAFLKPGCRIIDLGCGSGRDSLAFHRMGYAVTSVDGSEGMCRIARRNTGLEVRHLMFSELDYDAEFDAAWAFASLLHLPSSELPGILARIRRALVPGGVLLMSFKEGDFEGERDGRHYTDMMQGSLRSLAESNGFAVLDLWSDTDQNTGIRWCTVIVESIALNSQTFPEIPATDGDTSKIGLIRNDLPRGGSQNQYNSGGIPKFSNLVLRSVVPFFEAAIV